MITTINRGWLKNHPAGVVYIINGHPVTRADILAGKRRRQARELAWKRRSNEPVIKPCFIWTFYNYGFIYGGWWLYVQALKTSFNIDRHNQQMALRIMQLYPCGYLPIVENIELWKAEFTRIYHRPIANRPNRNGMVAAWAVISHTGVLLDVQRAAGG